MNAAVCLGLPSVANLISRMPGGIAQGIIWGIMALGLYITFRLLDIADLTVDGTFATGGAVAIMLITAGCPAWAAIIAATLAGAAAGLCTGVLHTRLGIPAILSGILTQFALYSINLRIMGMSANRSANPDAFELFISMRNVPKAILTGGIVAVLIVAVMYWFFGTEEGAAIRATGSNPNMSRAQGINTGNMKLIGLALSNGLVALSGSLMAQYQGFADVNMGRGSIVIGLAAIIIGEVLCTALFRKGREFYMDLLFVIIGGIVYYMVMIVILWCKLDPNDLKLFTALIVAAFLAVPHMQSQRKSSFGLAGKRSLQENKKA